MDTLNHGTAAPRRNAVRVATTFNVSSRHARHSRRVHVNPTIFVQARARISIARGTPLDARFISKLLDTHVARPDFFECAMNSKGARFVKDTYCDSSAQRRDATCNGKGFYCATLSGMIYFSSDTVRRSRLSNSSMIILCRT